MDESPVKKKRRKGKKRAAEPKKCLIHVNTSADDSTLSAFTTVSWRVSIIIPRSFFISFYGEMLLLFIEFKTFVYRLQ